MEGTNTKILFKAIENRRDPNEYYWTVVGLTPYTKYKFRVVISLLGSNIESSEKHIYSDIDFESATYIVTQPSLVVRTAPSEKEAPSKPIITSVQQVRFSDSSFES